MGSRYLFDSKHDLFFTTTTVVDWLDIFTRPEYVSILYDSLEFCQKHKGLKIHGYVIMTNHFHLIVSTESRPLFTIFRDLKQFTSKQIVKAIEENPSESRKSWLLRHLAFRGKNNSDNTNFQVWQKGNHPKPLWSLDVIRQKLEYIHLNPVRAGIVFEAQHYMHSSAFDYAGGNGLLEISLLDI
jgi:REP element-mobilizing transposase RayT